MADIFVTIMCLNTTYVKPSSSSNAHWPAWCLLDLGAKLTTLESVVKAAHKRVVTLNSGRNPDLHLFTAPEFAFAAHEKLVDLAKRDLGYTMPNV